VAHLVVSDAGEYWAVEGSWEVEGLVGTEALRSAARYLVDEAKALELEGVDRVIEASRYLKTDDGRLVSDAKRRGFLGWMVENSRGYASHSSFSTEAEYRRYARELGLTTARVPDVFGGTPGFGARLGGRR
jgi:hypothetical protein